MIINGALRPTPTQARVDWTAVRLSMQVGAAVAAPFILASLTEAVAHYGGAGVIVGAAFGTALVKLTADEAAHINAERTIALEQARELARIEMLEREARLPRWPKYSRALRGVVQQPVPDGDEADEPELSDEDYLLDHGKRLGSFARADFIKPNQPRMVLPSGDELTRPRFEQIIRRLLESGQLV
ncbi:MAG: hypothetical protein LC737_05440, partial [Chloroflexi bacterium]|nr:hypothetical protein [Chloroflexota bacterium]